MARKPWNDIDFTNFWGWLKYADQFSLYFPYIVFIILGTLAVVTLGS